MGFAGVLAVRSAVSHQAEGGDGGSICLDATVDIWTGLKCFRPRARTSEGAKRLTVVALAVAASGCVDGVVVDQAPLRNFVVVTIRNDEGRTVKTSSCFDLLCSRHDIVDSIQP